MRIVVLGAGAVGGYFGGRLAEAGHDVAFVARGASLAALSTRGLAVESPEGAIALETVEVIDDPAALGVADLVVVAVKAWQVREAAEAARPLVGPATAVLPLQNGVEAPSRLAGVLGEGPVLGGLCRIICLLDAPGRVRHVGGRPHVTIGELDGSRTERVQAAADAFARARVEAEVADDITAAMWEKFLLIASFGGVGALTRAPIGVLRSLPETRALLAQSMAEIEALARDRAVALPPGASARAMAFLDGLPEDATASLQRDIADGRPSELEDHSGAVVRLARATGTDTPLHAIIRAALLPSERSARGGARP